MESTFCLDSVLPFNQQRLKTDEYDDIETFSTDVHLLFDNAIKFYQSDSQEHKDAIELQRVFQDAKARICTDEQGTFCALHTVTSFSTIFLPLLHTFMLVHHETL